MADAKSIIKRYWVFYCAGFIIIYGIKYFYSNAECDDLRFILAPTAAWVKTISGISFKWEPGAGYINNDFRFIIAPSCSGVQFMLITFATLLFSFVHRMRTNVKAGCWAVLSFGFSFFGTVFVNGFRIVISIYLPIYLSRFIQEAEAQSRLLTPERVHTIIGTAVYFASICVVYKVADYASVKMAGLSYKGSCRSFLERMSPLFWYLAIGLGIPLLNRAYRNDAEGFIGYSAIILGVCLIPTFIYHLMSMFYAICVRNKNTD